MNITELEKHLRDAPEASASVSARQHNDVMRAVRLAAPLHKKTMPRWAIPAWGVAMASSATSTARRVTEPRQPEIPMPVDVSPVAPALSLSALGGKLLTIPKNSTVPEKELELEIQRLKSDLQRFGLKS